MSKYGCHNKPRPTAGAPLNVQDGYVTGVFEYESGASDRIDRIVQVPFAMTSDCQYTRQHAADPECSGCVERNQHGKHSDTAR